MRFSGFGKRLLAIVCVFVLVAMCVTLPRGAYAASGYDPRTITMDGGHFSRHALDGQEAYCCNSYLSSPPNGTVLTNWHSGSLALDYVLYHSDGGPSGVSPHYGWDIAKWVVWAITEGELTELDYYSDGVTLNPSRATNHELYDRAMAFQNSGGIGPERGCSRIYDPPSSEYQPIVVCAVQNGSIKVSKTREGGNDDTFTFRVVANSGGTVVLDETFTLQGGGSRTFDAVAAGATYEVMEIDGAQHYETEWTNRTGTVEANKTSDVVCKNISHGWLRLVKDLEL